MVDNVAPNLTLDAAALAPPAPCGAGRATLQYLDTLVRAYECQGPAAARRALPKCYSCQAASRHAARRVAGAWHRRATLAMVACQPWSAVIDARRPLPCTTPMASSSKSGAPVVEQPVVGEAVGVSVGRHRKLAHLPDDAVQRRHLRAGQSAKGVGPRAAGRAAASHAAQRPREGQGACVQRNCVCGVQWVGCDGIPRPGRSRPGCKELADRCWGLQQGGLHARSHPRRPLQPGLCLRPTCSSGMELAGCSGCTLDWYSTSSATQLPTPALKDCKGQRDRPAGLLLAAATPAAHASVARA